SATAGAPPAICALSLHDALPISGGVGGGVAVEALELLADGEEFGHLLVLGGHHPELRDLLERALQRPRVGGVGRHQLGDAVDLADRKSTRLNSSHVKTSYAVFCL